MARRSIIVKAQRQRFKRRRGSFKPLSEEALNNGVFVDSKMKKFWSENIRGGTGVCKSHVPKDAVGLFDYRGHVKINPRQAYLDAIFPGLRHTVKSSELIAVERKIEEIKELENCPPDQYVVLWRTRHTCMMLFFSSSEAYLVLREWSVVKVSTNYGNPHRAKHAMQLDAIRWKRIHTFQLPPPNT